MSEWWTYRLSSFLLFSPATYARLVERYNAELWPLQLVTLATGVLVIVLLYRGPPSRGRWIGAILAVSWSWVAWAFLWRRYATINWAAFYFAIAFGAESLLLLGLGVGRNALRLRSGGWRHRAAVAFVGLAVAGVPAVGPLLGRPVAQSEIFGVAPDPTALATLAIVMLGAERRRWPLLPIPLLWCAISGATQWALHSPLAIVTPLLAALIVLLACRPRPDQTSIAATSGR